MFFIMSTVLVSVSLGCSRCLSLRSRETSRDSIETDLFLVLGRHVSTLKSTSVSLQDNITACNCFLCMCTIMFCLGGKFSNKCQ